MRTSHKGTGQDPRRSATYNRLQVHSQDFRRETLRCPREKFDSMKDFRMFSIVIYLIDVLSCTGPVGSKERQKSTAI